VASRNQDYAGGDLVFPEFGRRPYRAPMGGAVVFSCGALHQVMPVTKGRRYAFLAHAALREANNAKLHGNLRTTCPAPIFLFPNPVLPPLRLLADPSQVAQSHAGRPRGSRRAFQAQNVRDDIFRIAALNDDVWHRLMRGP
jgi:hypothetical protein